MKKFAYNATTPTKAHPTDVGFDMYSTTTLTIPPGSQASVRTGVGLIPPEGTYIRLAERSGLA
jgi:dUTP pyrophosphatase